MELSGMGGGIRGHRSRRRDVVQKGRFEKIIDNN